MYDTYRERADFYIVYIAEAHTVDGWQTDSNEQAGIRISQHTTFEERLAAAELCTEKLRLTIPILVDGMDNAAFEAFSAWPERIYIIDPHGMVHYRGGPGPFDFKPEEALASLMGLVNAGNEDTS
jgi:hypothetical protein